MLPLILEAKPLGIKTLKKRKLEGGDVSDAEIDLRPLKRRRRNSASAPLPIATPPPPSLPRKSKKKGKMTKFLNEKQDLRGNSRLWAAHDKQAQKERDFFRDPKKQAKFARNVKRPHVTSYRF